MKKSARAFTLIELLTTVAIIAVLASLVIMMIPKMRERSQMAASLSNLRQIGTAFQLYANDNDFSLPSRVTSGDKWPKLLVDYLGGDPKVYAEPGNTQSFLFTKEDPISNTRNNTSYIMNGYNDVGAFEDETVTVKINTVEQPSKTILAATQSGSRNFYMDFAEGNHTDILDLEAYGNGSNYLFVDGSSRFIKKDDYEHELWLVDKESAIP